MYKVFCKISRLLILLGLSLSGHSLASISVVNVYNWSGYIPTSVLIQFERETGIHVRYSTFDNNEVLYTKLKANLSANYDVIVPSSSNLQHMIEEGMLIKLDKSKLPNMKYLFPKLLNQPYDPHNQYSLPYLWGTTGIIINTRFYSPQEVKSWKDLWKPKFRRKIAVLDSVRDIFGVSFKVLGYSINDRNPDHIHQAYLKLSQLLPNVQSFQSDGTQQMYVNEDAHIGITENGDANLVIRENPSYRYIYPKEGVILWVDNMAIPKGVKNLDNAYQFMNFVMRPDIAKKISEGIGFTSPNQKAIQLMSKAWQQNRILHPLPADLEHAEIEGYLPREINDLYLKYWEMFKLKI